MPKPEITPAQAFGILIARIDRRKEVLLRVSETSYRVAIAELDIVRNQLAKAQRYFVSRYSETTIKNQH